MKKLAKLLFAGLTAFGLAFSVNLGVKENKQVQEIQATGESENSAATINQVVVSGATPNVTAGLTFADGVLTATKDFTGSELLVDVNTNGEKADLKIVIYKGPIGVIFRNNYGNLTVEAHVMMQIKQIKVSGNLTIKGTAIVSISNTVGDLPLSGYSIIYAGEKLIIEDSVDANFAFSSSSFRKSVCAKEIEINTKNKVSFNGNTSSPTSSYRFAAVAIHDCKNADELANRLTIKLGKVSFKKYYDEVDTQYNDNYGFVTWDSQADGNMSQNKFDTDNIFFTGFPITVTNTDLVVKARCVGLEKNGGIGNYVSLGYYVLGSVVTLPECPYLAPSGQHFKGWALESTSATPLKQPGDTFTFGEGTDPADWKNEYFNVYPIWEEDPEALTGTVTLTGTLKYGETLTANVTNTNDAGVLSYQWRRNGENIDGANGATYMVTEDDINRTLSVMVTSSVRTSYLLATASGKIDKADGPYAPSGITATACTNEYNSNGIISGVTADMEFKPSDSETWYPVGSPIIMSLPSGTYNVRYKETSTHKAGQIANVVVNAYNAPVLYSVTVNKGTANPVAAIAGTVVTITANAPEEGYEFDKWISSDVTLADANSTTTTFVMSEKNVTVTATYNPTAPALTGTVTITGNLKYNETLTASVTDTNNSGTLSYQWRRNGDDIASANSSTYKVSENDIGYTLSVKVSSSIETGFIVGTASGVISKADGPSAPTGITATACTTEDNNDGVIKGVTTKMEYKLSTLSGWADGTGSDITNLVPGTYNVRIKETSTHNAGQIANVVVNAYNAPVLYSVTVNKGTANPVAAIAGTVVTITADAPEDGYVFDKWVSTSGVVFADANSTTTTFVMPEKNVTVTATYKPVVVPPSPAPSSSGLSGGAIAGIIIASVLVVGIGGFALVWFVIKKKTWADFVAIFKKK